MNNDNNIITYFAKTNFRNERVAFGIKKADRTKHMYVIGKTGMGKTTLLENLAVQDIKNGEGVGIVDPHGSFAEKMLDYVPQERIKDVIYFNPSDMEYPIALNIMEDVGMDQRHLVAAGLMGVFKKMWPDVWSARMEYILNNTILALLEYPNATLLGVNRMLADKEYRKKVVDNVKDPIVKAFWEQEFAKYTDRFAAEATPAIQNKVGQFTSNPLIRNIIGQPKSSFDFREAMDNHKIVIMNLSKGRVGELNSQLIGAMLITKIYLAAMSRAKNTQTRWPDFYLHVDEFQNFATESFRDILSEARKYGLGLIMSHQYINQLEEGVRDAVFGNVGTHIVFRVGATDAEFLEKEFSPEFIIDDIVNLGFASIYLKLSIDGVPSRPFSAVTLPPLESPPVSFREEIIEFSRKQYCGTKENIEKEISDWHIENNAGIKIAGSSSGVLTAAAVAENIPPKLYEAQCSVCSKKTLVPFEPDPSRPVFCQKHRSYLSEPKKETKIFSKEQVALPVSPPVETFSVPVPKPVAVSRSEPRKEISLKDLGEKTTVFKSEFKKKKTGVKPDFKGLRDILSESGLLDDSEQQQNDDIQNNSVPPADSGEVRDEKQSGPEKVLKPGDSIKI